MHLDIGIEERFDVISRNAHPRVRHAVIIVGVVMLEVVVVAAVVIVELVVVGNVRLQVLSGKGDKEG
mgnify:CR=1 FL=1